MRTKHTTTLLTALALLASPADAVNRALVTSYEFGDLQIVGGVVPPMWGGYSGTPTVSTAGADTSVAGNTFALQLNPASGASEYLDTRTFTASHEASSKFTLRVATLPTVERRIRSFRGSTGTLCFATVAPDGSGYRVRVYFNDAGSECAQSESNGKVCTSLADCVQSPEGGATCQPATFASSQQLALNVSHEILLTQDTSRTDPHDVSCGLYVDGVERGTAERPQGECSGGDLDGYACGASADCTGGGTCSSSTISQATVLRIGTDDSGSSALEYYVDQEGLDPTSVDLSLRRTRVFDLHPTANGSVNDWSNCNPACNGSEYTAVDDSTTAAPDGDTSEVNSGTNGHEERYDVCTAGSCLTLGAGESLQAGAIVALTCTAREVADNGNTGKLFKYGLRLSAGSETLSADFDTETIDGDGAYQQPPQLIPAQAPDSAAWTTAKINGTGSNTGLRVKLLNTTTAGTTAYRSSVTDCVVEVEVTTPLPTDPNVLRDENGDGEITFVIVGDSRMFDIYLGEALVGQLEQPVNLYQAALGGREIGDIDVALDTILDGTNTAWLKVFRGTAGRKVDYVVLDASGINDFHDFPTTPVNGHCFGGANDGGTCNNPRGSLADSYLPICSGGFCTATTQPCGTNGDCYSIYCREGADALTSCRNIADGTCPAGTCVGGRHAGAACSTAEDCARCKGMPLGPYTSWDLLDATSSWCNEGSIESPGCPGGLCVQRAQLAYTLTRYRSMIARMLARSGSSEVHPILFAPFLPQESPEGWASERPEMMATRQWVLSVAGELGLDTIDGVSLFWRESPDHKPNRMLRDDVHPLAARACTCNTAADCGSNEVCESTVLMCQATSLSAISGRTNCDDDSDCATGKTCYGNTGDQATADAIEHCLEGTWHPDVHCNLWGTPAPDWTSAFAAVWKFENDLTAGGSCGADCTLTNNNSAGYTEEQFREGKRAIYFDKNRAQTASCAGATCNELAPAATDFSVMCWAHPNTMTVSHTLIRKQAFGGVNGYSLARGFANSDAAFTVCDGTDCVSATSAASTWPAQAWHHWAGTFKDSTDTLTLYRDAVSVATATQQTVGASAQNFELGSVIGPTYWNGEMDECAFHASVALSASSICRVLSCGVDGLACSCSTTTPANYIAKGRNALMGGCTLPACDEASPS